MARYLVVAHETVGNPKLVEKLKEIAKEDESAEFVLLVHASPVRHLLVDGLGRSRVVTLSGVGGVGKTRLALRVAADARSRYRDGSWICELAAVADAAAVPDLVATTLGVQHRLGHTVTDRLVEYLRGRSMLLLLDNCEHVLGTVAGLVDNLVRTAPG
jgi:predicted ATPase